MNITVEFTDVEVEALSELRSRYLDALLEAQEALIEVMIGTAQGHLMRVHGEIAGYGISREGTLLELFIVEEYLPAAHLLFRRLVKERSIQRAWVKSFDHVLLACAMDIQISTRVMGILVRELVKRELPRLPGISYQQRAAVADDAQRLLAVEGNVFRDPARLTAAIAAGRIRVFEQGERLVAFGLLKPVVPGRPHVDLGLVVDTPFRRRGYAAYVLRDLIEHCEQQGLIPISGCAADNLASINLGLRVGFVSRYRLLETSFAPAQG